MSQQTDCVTYATQAELALAAYADFGGDSPRIENLRRVGMTDSQVEDFLNTWKHVVQINDTLTGVSMSIFEHTSDARRCLAISCTQPHEPCNPGEDAMSAADISLKPGSLYMTIKEQVSEWIGNGILPKGSTVAGHFVGGYFAIALKKEFLNHISDAYYFMGDTSGKIYGLADNGVFATNTHKSTLDLSDYPKNESKKAIAGGADDKPFETDIPPGKLEETQTINKQVLEDDSMKRLAAILLALELLTGCVTLTKMQMDAEVDRLCAIDGGVKIYETVSLPPEKFNEYNQINFFHPTQGENTLGPEYIWKSSMEFLQQGGDSRANPRMWRYHIQIFRRSDDRLLGEFTSYVRYGGDSRLLNELKGGPPESHYSCPNEKIDEGALFSGIFIKNITGGMK